MTIIAHSNVATRGSDPYITVDKYGRLCLSVGLRMKLDMPGKGHIPLYVGYDKVNKRIGIARLEVVRLTDVLPYRFDVVRGYAMARKFLRDNEIQYDETTRYVDSGNDNGWHTFQLSGYEAPDSKHQPKAAEPPAKPSRTKSKSTPS